MAGSSAARGTQRLDDLTLLLRALGLRSNLYNQVSARALSAINVHEPAPYDFTDNVVLIALAAGVALMEGNDHEIPKLLTVAIGRAKLDTDELAGVAPGGLGKAWAEKIEKFCYKLENNEAPIPRARQLGEVARSFSEGCTITNSEFVAIEAVAQWADLGNEPAETYTGKVLIIAEEDNLAVLEQEIGRRFRKISPTSAPVGTADEVCKLVLGGDADLVVTDRAVHIMKAALAIVVGHAAGLQSLRSTSPYSVRSSSSNQSFRTASTAFGDSKGSDWDEGLESNDGIDRVRTMAFGPIEAAPATSSVRVTASPAVASPRATAGRSNIATVTAPAPAIAVPAIAAMPALAHSTAGNSARVVDPGSVYTQEDRRNRNFHGPQYIPKRIHDCYMDYDTLTKILEHALVRIGNDHHFPQIRRFVYQTTPTAQPILMTPTADSFMALVKFAVTKVAMDQTFLDTITRNIELRTFVSDWFMSMRQAEGLAEDGPVAAKTKKHREFTRMLILLKKVLAGA